MKRFLNWIIVLAACVGAFYGVGLIVPRSQTQGAKAAFGTKPAEIFEALNDLTTWPEWHPNFASVQERPEKDDHAMWRVLTKDGRSFELEVLGAEDEKFWNGAYSIDGTRTTLRFDLTWYGSGSRLRAMRNTDTRDPWVRARDFFLPSSEAEPVALLSAFGTYFGESVKAETN